ncbi:hypothetical protein D3C74_207530 [compost metagenome]
MYDFGHNPVPKKTNSVRVKLTQKQMGDISPKVRKEVRERSKGLCEVRLICNGAQAVQQAHITGRTHLNHKTTADDLLDSCLECHIYLDSDVMGIRTKRLVERVLCIK